MCIVFAGAVFSPDYALRLRRGERALPTEHAAVNLAIYRGGRQVAWVMSEYPRLEALSETRVVVGGTIFERGGDGVTRIVLRDRTAPFATMVTGGLGARVEGEIVIEPVTGPCEPCSIATAGAGGQAAHHGWQALAPRARVHARFSRPDFRLDATGYLDRNHGDGRLEDAFARWGWARFHGAGETAIVYAFEDRVGRRRTLLLRCPDGGSGASPSEPPVAAEGPPRDAGWGLQIPSRFGAAGLACEPAGLLERSPFYARFQARLVGQAGHDPGAVGLGEWLDLDRFRSPLRQMLLRFRTRGC